MTGLPNLNRLLVLEAVARTPDGAGGFAEVPVDLGRLWAQVESRSVRGRGAEDADLATGRYRITVRAAPPGAPSRPLPGHVLREGPRRYRIEAVADAGSDGRYLHCLATEDEVAR